MRQRSYLVDNMVSTSFLLGWDADIVAGKTYRVTVPMLGLLLDMRGMSPALFSTFEDLKIFAPDGVKVQLINIDKKPSAGSLAQLAYSGGDLMDPARDVRYVLQFEITFDDDVTDASDVLMVLWGKPIATGISPPSWPEVEFTDNPPIEITTAGGTPITVNAKVVAVVNTSKVDWNSGIINKPEIYSQAEILNSIVTDEGDVVVDSAMGNVVFDSL